MTWGHYELTPNVPKNEWLIHVEKNPYVACQVYNPDKHHLDRKSREAQELVHVCSSAKDIDNWHAQNVHAKVFLLNLHVPHNMILCHQKTQNHRIDKGMM